LIFLLLSNYNLTSSSDSELYSSSPVVKIIIYNTHISLLLLLAILLKSYKVLYYQSIQSDILPLSNSRPIITAILATILTVSLSFFSIIKKQRSVLVPLLLLVTVLVLLVGVDENITFCECITTSTINENCRSIHVEYF